MYVLRFSHLLRTYIILVLLRRYAPDSYVLFLHEFTIHFMVLVKKNVQKYENENILVSDPSILLFLKKLLSSK